MKHVTELIKEKPFTISVEAVPPRNGSSLDKVRELFTRVAGKVDFVSVTKGAGGSLRAGTLPVSFIAQHKFGIPAVTHVVCREHTRQELENELMELHYMGITNVLALRGDPPAGQKGLAWDGDYEYAHQLIRQIHGLNHGRFLPRLGMEREYHEGEPTDFCILAAGHPEELPGEFEHVKAKLDAGAQVIITQMIFTAEEFKAYRQELAGLELPVIVGVRPLTSFEKALSSEKFFGIRVPDKLKLGLKMSGRMFGINYAALLIGDLMRLGAAGVHLFTLNDIELTLELLKRIR